MAPSAATLERYLHERIPLSANLGVRVSEAGVECVRLSAPLAPNINHNGTVFGGSAAALATLAAWGLLHVRLETAGIRARTLIQRSQMEYERPISGDFEAECRLIDASVWERFSVLLARRGRSRIALAAQLRCEAHSVGRFEGKFVALAAAHLPPDPGNP